MKLRPKITLKIALFSLVLAFSLARAEVKLRIYLRDGTLQAGTLISETTDAFVLMTKQDRVEIPKDRIMFVNGKTLKQWEAHPDKLYQTEIIPSEIPNPAYVNEKAALPASPKPVVPPVEPLAVPPPAPVVEVKPEPPAQTMVPEAKPEPEVKAPPPVVVPVKRAPRQRKAKPAPQQEVTAKEPERQPEIRPRGFDRKAYADYHYQTALRHLETGAKGRAFQELHIATILDRGHDRALLLLGRLYMEAQVYGQAEKYFSYPVVRKKEEVKNFILQIKQEKERRERETWVWEGAAAAGAFSSVPLVFLWRRLRKKPARVISADALRESDMADLGEEALESPIVSLGEGLTLVRGPDQAAVSTEAPGPLPIEPPTPEIAYPTPPLLQPPPPMQPPQRWEPPTKPPEEPVQVPVYAQKPVEPEPEEVRPPEPPEPRFKETAQPVAAGPYPLEDPETSRLVNLALQSGNGLAEAGEIEPARRQYKTALALRPPCTEACLGLGYLCSIQEQWELALEHYRAALDLDPGSADAHYGLGRSLLELGRREEAVPPLRKALEIDPTFEDARDTLTALGKAA